jgi:hypothetical protein
VPTKFLVREEENRLDLLKNSGLRKSFVCITAGLEMRWDREIADFSIEFEDRTVGGYFGSKCIDHYVVQEPRKFPRPHVPYRDLRTVKYNNEERVPLISFSPLLLTTAKSSFGYGVSIQSGETFGGRPA